MRLSGILLNSERVSVSDQDDGNSNPTYRTDYAAGHQPFRLPNISLDRQQIGILFRIEPDRCLPFRFPDPGGRRQPAPSLLFRSQQAADLLCHLLRERNEMPAASSGLLPKRGGEFIPDALH